MGRLSTSIIGVSMLGTALGGCAPSERAVDSTPSTTAAVSIYDDPHLRGGVTLAEAVERPPVYTPNPCTAQQRQEIVEHLKSGHIFRAEVLLPNIVPGVEAVGVREADSNQHNGLTIKSPLVLRCSGKVVEFAGFTSRDTQYAPVDNGNDVIEVIPAEGAIFIDANEAYTSPSRTATRQMDDLGHFEHLPVRAFRESGTGLPDQPNTDMLVGLTFDGQTALANI